MSDTILLGVVGSQAYGLANAQSDIDRLGVYQAPTKQILGLESVQETKVTKDDLGDFTLHELGKFVRLCINCNPTVMELLWLESYTRISKDGQALVNLRKAFLSEKAVNSYMGYAFQQATRLLSRGDFDPDLKKRTAKHGRHCWRLLIQGEWLIQTGQLKVRLNSLDAEACFKAGLAAQNDPQGFYDIVKDRCDTAKENGRGVLPEHPDIELINKTLVYLRLKNLS